MFEWLRRRATDTEVAVARAILEGSGDRRAELLSEQFRGSRRVERRIEGATMRVMVPWTTEDLLVDLDEDVTSDRVRVHDTRSGQALGFRVHLARGGFFRSLEGVADSRWPRRWDVNLDELATEASGALSLPVEPSSDALAEWLGLAIPAGPGVIVREPAMTEAVYSLQQREGLALPAQVREFLEVTDGMVVDSWAILGVRDLCVVEVEGRTYWQIAVWDGAGDDRRCLLTPDGGSVIVPAIDAQAEDFGPVGIDLRKWIAGLIVRSKVRPER